MRKPRLKTPPRFPVAYYHCASRVADRQVMFEPAEKAQLAAWIREYERFCGVRVLTHCVMSDHFHVLVEVQGQPEEALSDAELLARLDDLTGMSNAEVIRQQLSEFRKQGKKAEAEALRERILARMGDLGGFMKLLKQRFTQWYNRRQGRHGTLWEQRYKSALVEGTGDAIALSAAYIDLNPVRAELVEDPKDYRWCGYGEAMKGSKLARQGLKLVLEAASQQEVADKEVLNRYRRWLYGQVDTNDGSTEESQPARKRLTPEEVAAVVKKKGRLPLREFLRQRVRYFTDGQVVGSREYVNEVFNAWRGRFGPKRKDGARRMRYVDHEGLYSLRDLQKGVVANCGPYKASKTKAGKSSKRRRI